jgi:hypothetical protein
VRYSTGELLNKTPVRPSSRGIAIAVVDGRTGALHGRRAPQCKRGTRRPGTVATASSGVSVAVSVWAPTPPRALLGRLQGTRTRPAGRSAGFSFHAAAGQRDDTNTHG